MVRNYKLGRGSSWKWFDSTEAEKMHKDGLKSINIKLIDQSTEELNIIIGISNQDFNKSIEVLYNKFAFEKID